jgi:hypothetical protein
VLDAERGPALRPGSLGCRKIRAHKHCRGPSWRSGTRSFVAGRPNFQDRTVSATMFEHARSTRRNSRLLRGRGLCPFEEERR